MGTGDGVGAEFDGVLADVVELVELYLKIAFVGQLKELLWVHGMD